MTLNLQKGKTKMKAKRINARFSLKPNAQQTARPHPQDSTKPKTSTKPNPNYVPPATVKKPTK